MKRINFLISRVATFISYKSLISIVGVLLTFQVLSANGLQSDDSEDIRSIQVLTFNLWDVGEAVGEYTDQRIEAVCQLFKEAYQSGGWDIILVQELWPIKNRKDALKDCGYPHILNADREYNEVIGFFHWLGEKIYGDRIDTGLWILSRFPMSGLERHTYSKNGSRSRIIGTMTNQVLGEIIGLQDAEYMASKSAISVTVVLPNIGPILVVNTHLVSNFEDTHLVAMIKGKNNNYYEQRWLQLNELSEFVKQNVGPHVATIIGGDFNIGPLEDGNEPYRNPEYDWNDIMLELFPDFYHATDIGCTYCPLSNLFAKVQGGSEQRIDHILASRNLVVKGIGIVDKKISIEGDMEIPLSDHYGVEVNFTISYPKLLAPLF